jgi:hypothetical protein
MLRYAQHDKVQDDEVGAAMNGRFAAIALVLISAVAFGAQEPAKQEQPTAEFRAARAPQAPRIDGVLDEEVWSLAPEITGFTQRDPDEGKPATETTVVKVLYDDDAIYFGARLDDSGPVTTLLGRRDTVLESDWFRIYLDPHLDRRSGASFWINPSNVQLDMVLYNDSWDDLDWDAVWESQTKISPTGWVAEVRIPYSQLRFPDRPQHVWGLNFIRRIARRNEMARLVHVPKTESGFVSRFARLTGIEGIRPKRALELMPYGVSRSDFRGTANPADPFNASSEYGADAGLDVKYGLTTNLTLTGTLNPDFGQVEVDPARVNLSQFELFFPEKRPFFIEGASLFEFGFGGSNNNFTINFSPPTLFYSRRIGRAPQGVGRFSYDYLGAPGETTILAAGKITGKTGNGWTIAALDALTDEETALFSLGGIREREVVEPMTNYLVTRMAKDLGEKGQGRIGTLFTATNRDLTSELDFLREHAYLLGVDGHWFFGKRDWILEWFLAGTEVGGSTTAIANTQLGSAHYYQRPDASHIEFDPQRDSLSGLGGRVTLAKQTGKWRYNLQAQSYTPGFEINDIGFLQRADATGTHLAVLYDNREPKGNFRDRGGWIAKWQNWNFDGDLTQNGIGGVGYVVYKNYWQTWFEVFHGMERLDDRATRGGPLMRQPANIWFGTGGNTDYRKKYAVDWATGHYDTDGGGAEHDYRMGFIYRPTSNLSIKLNPSFNIWRDVAQYVRTVPDPTATETYGARYIFADIAQRTVEVGTRVEWTFSSKLSFQLYLQPLIVAGEYKGFKELRAPRTFDFLVYGVDDGNVVFDPVSNRYTVAPRTGADSREAAPFTFGNPDFNFRSVRGNAVVRWEFRPGSALYAVWNENRAESRPFGDFRFNRDFSAIPEIESDDVIMIKVSYWLAL